MLSTSGVQALDPLGVDVLVVDDEPMVREFIAKVLTRNGYTCRVVSDAGEALAEAIDRPPTVAISDVRMPGRDGNWLLTELRKRLPETPVIMLTAVADAKNAVECLKAGAHDYLVKPIDLDELLISVKRGAERVHLFREARRHRRDLEEAVRERTAQLQNVLQTIEATYQDALGALVNAESVVEVGPAAPPIVNVPPGALRASSRSGVMHEELGVEQSIELSSARIAARLLADGASHVEVATAIGKELVENGMLLSVRLWAKQGNEHGLEALVDVGGGALTGVSIAGRAIAQKKTQQEEESGVTSVAAPIIVRGVAECVLQLAWNQGPRDELRTLTERLALVLAASLSREHDSRERHRTAEQLAIFQKLASATRYSLDLKHVATFLMRSLHRVVDYDVAALLLLEEEQSLNIQARFQMDEEFAGRVRSHIMNTLKLTYGLEPSDPSITVIEGDIYSGRPAPHKLRSFVNVPLSVGEAVVGLIHVSSGREQAFSDEEILFVHRAAEFLASSVQGVRHLLATVKSRVELMVDHMTDGVLMLDARGRVVAVNQAARRALGLEDDCEAVGSSMLAALLECDPMSLMRSERRNLRRLVCIRGIPYQAQLSPVEDEAGELVGTVLAFRDFEEEKKADEMKSELISVVSHELRTPLTAIKNALTLLRGPRLASLNEEQHRFVDLAKRNVERLIDIINDLLDLSKIEAGKMHFDLERMSLEEPVGSALDSLRPQAEEKGVELQASIAPDLPTIHGHTASLQRVLVNLVGNAIKFTERDGRVCVDVRRADAADEPNSKGIRVTVSDSGVGIPEEEMESIFDKFHQVRPHSLKSTSGTGLGLSICRELVRAHHGNIWVESEPGVGSRFSFFIPVLSQKELLLRSISTELARTQERNESVVLVLGRLVDSEGVSEDAIDELLAATRRAVRRSSDRVLKCQEEAEIAVLLPRTPRDGGRAFSDRVREELEKNGLSGQRTNLRFAAVLYPDDASSAHELYRRAAEQIRETAAA